jgi:UDP-glucose 4-epimerase
VATGQATTIRELAQVIAARWGMQPLIEHGPERPGEIRHSLGSVEHLQRMLDFRPNCSLRAGLETLS